MTSVLPPTNSIINWIKLTEQYIKTIKIHPATAKQKNDTELSKTFSTIKKRKRTPKTTIFCV